VVHTIATWAVSASHGSRPIFRALTDEAEANQFIGIAEEMEAKAAALETACRQNVDRFGCSATKTLGATDSGC